MNITQVIVHGILKPDGTLELNQRVDLPPGEVQITLRSVGTSCQSREDLPSFLQRIRAGQQARGHTPRTREDIDSDLNVLRQEAEEEMHEIENMQSHRNRHAQ